MSHHQRPLFDPLCYVNDFLVLGSSALDTALHVYPHQHCAERQNHLSQTAGSTAAQDTIILLCSKRSLMAYFLLGKFGTPRSFSAMMLSIWVSHSI